MGVLGIGIRDSKGVKSTDLPCVVSASYLDGKDQKVNGIEDSTCSGLSPDLY